MTGTLRCLVVIANHGTKNCHFLDHVLREYRAMSYDVQLVVLSDRPKDLGPDVEVVVGAPTRDPWSLPFGHKALFADRQDEFDLFIYSEDDILIRQDQIEAFLQATEELPEDKIAGFSRFEEDQHQHRFCCDMHSHYHWRPGSLQRHGSHAYAYFTNMHSACYVLTRAHLKRCIDSGGFLVPPHEGCYDLLCSAATDPYTQCGLEKILCLSRIEAFLVHHLPNRYVGQMGISYEQMHAQVDKIIELGEHVEPVGLIPETTGLNTWRYEKHYYGPADDLTLGLVPSSTRSVLSVGCGQGETEGRLIESGRAVDAIPLDPYIGVLPELQRVKCFPACWESLFAMPGETKYDLILLADLLCYVDDPVAILKACRQHITPNGCLCLSFRNERCLDRHRQNVAFGETDVHYRFCDSRTVKRWLNAAGWEKVGAYPVISGRRAILNRLLGGLPVQLLSPRFVVRSCPRASDLCGC